MILRVYWNSSTSTFHYLLDAQLERREKNKKKTTKKNNGPIHGINPDGKRGQRLKAVTQITCKERKEE